MDEEAADTPRLYHWSIRNAHTSIEYAGMNLFEVVNADTSDESIDRFAKGLAKTVDLHDKLVETLMEDNADAV